MAKIKRSEVQSFMNTTPLAAATYSLIGDGVDRDDQLQPANVRGDLYP